MDEMFSKNPYFIIIQRFECYTTLIFKELLYNRTLNFFTSISKSVVTYITITVTITITYQITHKTILQYNKNVQSSSYCQKETVLQN